MFFLASGGVGLIIGLALGGKLAGLAQLRFRWPLVVAGALVVKEVAFLSPLSKTSWIPFVYLLSLVGLLAWTIWHWDKLPAVWLVSIGVAMNVMVVIANAGHMPVPLSLVQKAIPIARAIASSGSNGQYVVAGPNTHLLWLGDWLELPPPLFHFFPQAYSPGDIVMAVGMVAMLFLATGPKLGARSLQFLDRRPQRPQV